MDKKSSLVSIVIPLYNQEKFITQALDSIYNQSYSNIEVIIIDNGSNDRSVTKVEEYLANKKSAKKAIFMKQQTKGIHEILNLGFFIASGDWLTILLPDDSYPPNRIERLLKENKPFVFSFVNPIDENGIKLPPTHPWVLEYEECKFKLFHQNIPSLGFIFFKRNIVVTSGNLFFSKELFHKVGPFQDYKFAYDLDFILRALIFEEPVLIKDPLYYYRVFKNNEINAFNLLYKDELKKIYTGYLIQSFSSPPVNKRAPSYFHSPVEFGKIREELKMDHALINYIIPAKNYEIVKFDSTNKEIKKNLTKKNKISIVTHDLSLSGAPKLVLDIAICLKENGYEPNIISLSDGPLKSEFINRNFPLYILPKFTSLKSLFFSQMYAILFKTQKYCIINSVAGGLTLFLRSIFTPWKKTIWYIHESFPPLLPMDARVCKMVIPFYKYVSKFISPLMWFGSKGTQKAWENSGFEKGNVVYWSGINSYLKVKQPKEKLNHLLAVGTASTRKGTHLLVDAFISCIQKNKIPNDVVLTIIGFTKSYPSFDAIKDIVLKVVSFNLQDRIKMVESIDPSYLDYHYQQADIFIQPSLQECLPIALLKAMSIGLPIITTNVEGCGEAIQNGYSGYVCQPFDMDSLENAIIDAIHDPKRSWELGRNAQNEFNKNFSIEATKENLFNNLNGIL